MPAPEIENALLAIVAAVREAAPRARLLVLEIIPDGIERDCARRAGARLVPCPAHVVCSWITHNVNHLPYCSADHTYKSPNHPREWENEAHWRSSALPMAKNRDIIEEAKAEAKA